MSINTFDHKTINAEDQTPTPEHSMSRILRRIGMGLLVIMAFWVTLLTTIPIILLFFVTAVPNWMSAIIVLMDAGIIFAMLRFAKSPINTSVGIIGLILVALLTIFMSQRFASTPPITDANGDVMPGSIASLERVELNGSQQWVTIRGHREDLPVLLFLAGGPGGSELVMTRRYLATLEEHFIIVNWDQPGTGKSYNAVDFDDLTPDRYVEDAHALTLYLRERFDEEKIYVFGESWGSILGILLVQQHPELFHALVTTAQMVDVVENDILMYEFAIEQAIAQDRTNTVETLHRNGLPPYNSGTLIGRFGTMNGVVNDYMDSHAHGEGTGHNLMLDSLAAEEYGFLDKVYWLLGLARTFTTVYPQLYDLDFRTQATELDIPVYFIKGRWDINASNTLLEEYYTLLDAPSKELIWFEDSAHTPSWDEPQRFVDVMVNTVLADTQPPPLDTTTFSGYFDTQIPIYLREYNIAGAVVAVVQDGEPVHLSGYGFANLENRIAMNAELSIIHVGSLGKTFTAIAAMQLVEQELLDLDTDITMYLDFEIPTTYPQPITIRHLLTHTAGFEALDIGVILVDPDALPPIREYLIRNLPDRVRPPGETIGYSNYGMTLLGYIIERVTDMPLSTYLETSITAPLGMDHTNTQQMLPADLDGLSISYEALHPQAMEYVAAFGAAPVRSTAADMATYMIANLQLGRFGTNEVLQPDTARAMQTQQFSADPRLNGIGFGFYEMSRNDQRILGHLGTTAYFHSLLLMFPEQQLGIFVSFNSAEGAQVLRTGRFLDDLMDHFFPQTTIGVMPSADFEVRASDYEGTYFWNNLHGQSTLEKVAFLIDAVTIQTTTDNRLRVSSVGNGHTFTEIEPDAFIRSDGQDILVFHRNANGEVIGASLNSRAVFMLERRPWYEAPLITYVGLLAVGVIFILGICINAGALWLNRNADTLSIASISQLMALLMPLLNLIFIFAFVLLLTPLLRGELSESAVRLVLLLPIFALFLTLVLSGLVPMNWVQSNGSRFMRLQTTVLTVSGVVLALILHTWNLLGWRI